MTMTSQWTVPQPRPRRWPLALTFLCMALNATLAATALTIALSSSPLTPTYTPAQRLSAQAHLCSTFNIASDAVRTATDARSGFVAVAVVARNSLTNAALMLETAASNPALDSKYRDAGLTLVDAYLNTAAVSAKSMDSQARLGDDANVKSAAMQELCRE
ncbi:hypothetical protein [Mycolicibacter minnesotensis]